MVSTNILNVGSSYSLKYKDPWTNHDVVDVKIASITTDSESGSFATDSIYSEFFSAYNIGIASYVSAMAACNDIYVCQVVKSKDPINYEKGFVLIPKTIIDFDKSVELLQCDSITITIGGLVKYNNLAYDRGLYFENLISNMKSSIRNIEEIGDLNLNVVTQTIDILKPFDEYTSYEEFRKSSFDVSKLADIQFKSQKIREQRDILTSYNSLMLERENYARLTEDAEVKFQALNDAVALYNKNRDEVIDVRADINELLNGLSDGSIIINDARYVELKTKIQMFIVQV